MAQQPTQPNAIGTVTPPIAVGDGGVPPPPVGDGAFLEFDAVDAVFPTGAIVPAVPDGRGDHPLIAYAGDAENSVFFPSTMPEAWGGVELTVSIYWASPEIVGDVEWFMAIERDNGPGGVDLDVFSPGALKSVVSTAPGVTGELQLATIPFTAAEANDLAPGDPFRFIFVRDGGVNNDDLDGIAQLFRIIIEGPP